MPHDLCRAERIALGSYVVTWSHVDGPTPRGDGLFVDASGATGQWRSIADVIIHPEPATAALARSTLLSNGSAFLVVVGLGQDRWLVTGRDGREITVIAKADDELGYPLRPLTLLFRWALAGRSVATAPPAVVFPGRQGGTG